MNCLGGLPAAYLYQVVAIALALIIMALVGLVYACIQMRRAVLGKRMLEACANHWDTAILACENVRQENELMAEVVLRDINKGRK